MSQIDAGIKRPPTDMYVVGSPGSRQPVIVFAICWVWSVVLLTLASATTLRGTRDILLTSLTLSDADVVQSKDPIRARQNHSRSNRKREEFRE